MRCTNNTIDLKSVGRKAVPVRFRPSAPPYKPPLSAAFLLRSPQPPVFSVFQTVNSDKAAGLLNTFFKNSIKSSACSGVTFLFSCFSGGEKS